MLNIMKTRIFTYVHDSSPLAHPSVLIIASSSVRLFRIRYDSISIYFSLIDYEYFSYKLNIAIIYLFIHDSNIMLSRLKHNWDLIGSTLGIFRI